MPDYQSYRSAFQGQRLPLAWVDLDLLEQNAADIAQRANAKTIRIASKSIRCRTVIERILASSPVYQGIMSFTADEALFLLSHGLDDILIAYPVVHGPHILALAKKIRDGARVWVMVDRPEHIDVIQRALSGTNLVMPVCVDIDMSTDFPGLHFGVWRSSIRSMAALRQFVDCVLQSNSVELRAVMGYEAQIAGLGDAVEGKWLMNRVVKTLKGMSIPRLARFRAEAVEYLRSSGVSLDLVNGGGTGSLDSTTSESVVTEVTVGSGFYNSHLFDNYSGFQMQPAAGYAIAVTRIPKPHLYTCLGGGYIASGAVESTRAPRPYLPSGAMLTNMEGAGEVQTPISYSGAEQLQIGSPILMRHGKAGELCEHFNEICFVRDGQIEERAPTYRGEGQCFL